MKKSIILIAMLSAGCTTTARMDIASIDDMRIDCSKKQEQLDFLRAQWPSHNEQISNGMTITSSLGYILTNADGTYQKRRVMADGGYTSTLRLKIEQVKSVCANYPPY